MKIKSPNENLPYLDRVNSREDPEASGDDHERRREQNRDREGRPEKGPKFEVTDEKVDAAIQAFTEDQAAAETGIQAVTRGTGPGLKVVLQDRMGRTVRQLSGAEFVELREKIKAGGSSGKILDKKV